jgi:hypothetical protein
MEPSEAKKTQFAKWVELAGERYPIADWFGSPQYAQETITERVEPWATQYDEQSWELPYDCPECGEPDAKFYTPTPLLVELQDRLEALRRRGFREVPNPDYDPERAAAYWAKQRDRYNQTQITVGQSYAPTRTPG